jgi:hypothetical protein
MAAGDVQTSLQSIADGAYLPFRPVSSGIEWTIHNVHHEGAAELYFYDGTRSVLVASDNGQGSWLGMFLHCTNGVYYRLKNVAGSTKALGYDGLQTH